MSREIISFGQCFIDLYGSKLDQNYVSLKYDLRLGGGPGIFAIACGRFNHRCGLISTFSTDSFGKFLINIFEKENVDLKYTDVTDERTPLEFVESSKDFTDYKFYDINPTGFKINASKIQESLFRNLRVFYFTSFILTDDHNYEVLLKCLEYAKRHKVVVYFNLDFRSRLNKSSKFFERVKTALDSSDIAISNVIDFQQLFGTDDVKSIKNTLLKKGLKKIIFTFGRKGAELIDSNGKTISTKVIYNLPAKDRTGAGDIFAASFICNYLDGMADQQNLDYCHKLAALSTIKYGAIESIPKKHELELFNNIGDEDDLALSSKQYLIRLIDKQKNKLFFSRFLKDRHDANSLVITQKTYGKIKKFLKPKASNLIYITNSPRNKQSYLPTRLEQLFFIINLFSIKNKDGVVLIDCIDMLLKNNPFSNVMNFLRQIANLSIMTNVKFLLLVDYSKLTDDLIYEIRKFHRHLHSVQYDQESLMDIKGKYLKSHLGENLVDVKDKDELFKRIKDTLRDVYGYTFANIFLLEGEILQNTNKHAKRRFIHLDKPNIFKYALDTRKNMLINRETDDHYYQPDGNGADTLESISAIYFDAKFLPTVIIPVGKQEPIGVIEISKNESIKSNSNDYREMLSFIKNSFFLAEIFLLKEQAIETSKQLRHFDELKNNFLSMISHELRTPLTSIRGYTSLLRSKSFGEVNSKQDESLSVIEKETANLTAIINDLLDISKIESGKLDLYFDKENLKDVIKDAIKIMEGFSLEKGVNLKFAKSFKVIVNIDCSRVHQVLTNLINNAIKFSNPGTTISINMFRETFSGKEINDLQEKFYVRDQKGRFAYKDMDEKAQKEFICVEIEDQGLGIESKNLPLLFDKFFQVSNHLTRSTAGTGLGLSIVKHLVELHGGFIDVISDFGVGSKFRVYFPAKSE